MTGPQKYLKRRYTPPNTATVLECDVCRGQSFKVAWFLTPVLGPVELEPCWGLHCLTCGVIAFLDYQGPAPETVRHGN